jgi:UDP-N-acetylmuramoylalanine--D-glutamate ligase
VIAIEARRDQTIAVLGLGASGLAAARALAASGTRVFAWDDNAESRIRATAADIPLQDLDNTDFQNIDALLPAPGIPFTRNAHHLIEKARDAGCPIIGDIELLVEACPEARFIGVTGTNGKSTVTALIGHILDDVGIAAQIGGNFGPPALAFEPPAPGEIMVLELSSYQLDLTRNATFDIAILVNISPDHLDRHGDMENYVGAKTRIFRDRAKDAPAQTAIIGIDDDYSRTIHDQVAGRPGWDVISVSTSETPSGGVYVTNATLFDAIDGPPVAICNLATIQTLPGEHNHQNAATAFAAARALGVKPAKIAAALASYPGLPHRMETVAVIDGVRYINDSKATNAQAASKALGCHDAIYWIAGGLAKDGGLEEVLPHLNHVRHAFLIGQAEQEFDTLLSSKIAVSKCGDLGKAIAAAHALARDEAIDGAVVLLSPACASFDQWQNFEERGDAFRTLVQTLTAEGQP